VLAGVVDVSRNGLYGELDVLARTKLDSKLVYQKVASHGFCGPIFELPEHSSCAKYPKVPR
jgi:hypothetical protein